MNLLPQQQIESYLRGELSPEQLVDFNQLLDGNPGLSEQVRLEEKIVKGLSDVRKAELKARLDAIEVAPTGWMSVGQVGNAALVKTLGGIVAVSLVAGLVYTYVTNEPANQSSEELMPIVTEINHPVEQTIPQFDWNLTPNLSSAEEPMEGVHQEELNPESLMESSNTSELVAEQVPNTLEKEEFDVKVSIPQPDDVIKEEGLSMEKSGLPEVEAMDVVSNGEVAPVEVEMIAKKNEQLKYKYFDGKLFLYGDFSEQPYEILEINGVKERKLYLYFDKKYFSIGVSDKVKSLNPIDNQNQVSELEIIRNNKK